VEAGKLFFKPQLWATRNVLFLGRGTTAKKKKKPERGGIPPWSPHHKKKAFLDPEVLFGAHPIRARNTPMLVRPQGARSITTDFLGSEPENAGTAEKGWSWSSRMQGPLFPGKNKTYSWGVKVN